MQKHIREHGINMIEKRKPLGKFIHGIFCRYKPEIIKKSLIIQPDLKLNHEHQKIYSNQTIGNNRKRPGYLMVPDGYHLTTLKRY